MGQGLKQLKRRGETVSPFLRFRKNGASSLYKVDTFTFFGESSGISENIKISLEKVLEFRRISAPVTFVPESSWTDSRLNFSASFSRSPDISSRSGKLTSRVESRLSQTHRRENLNRLASRSQVCQKFSVFRFYHELFAFSLSRENVEKLMWSNLT